MARAYNDTVARDIDHSNGLVDRRMVDDLENNPDRGQGARDKRRDDDWNRRAANADHAASLTR